MTELACEYKSNLSLNVNDYFGPDREFVFEKYGDVPFAPFNRLKKNFTCCDFSNKENKIFI